MPVSYLASCGGTVAPGVISRRVAVLFVVAISLLLQACANIPRLDDRHPQTTMRDTVFGTDLTARRGEPVRPAKPKAPGPGSMQANQLFPGNDRATAGRPRDNQFAGVRPNGNGFELNFENANLADTVKLILGDTLGKPYVYDNRIQGQVTLSTGRPVSDSELLTILEVVLQMNNAALVMSEGKYRIIPAGNAVSGTQRLVSLAAPGAKARPGYGVSILPLRHISAKQMLSLLQGFVVRSGSVRADVTRNLLLLRGSGPDRRTLLDVASSFDLDWLKGRAAGIFPLKYATAEEIIGDLEKLLESRQGGRGHGTVKFEAIERLNAVLVLAHTNKMLRTVASWVSRLDKSNNGGVRVYVYHVEHGKAVALARILNATFSKSGNGAGVDGGDSDVAPGEQETTLARNEESGFGRPSNGGRANGDAGGQESGQPEVSTEPGETGNGASNGTHKSNGQTQFSGSGSDEIRIVPDKANNTLVIRARPRDYRRVLDALRSIDKPPLQILINATIAEVTLNDTLRYGVQFFLRGKKWGGVNVGGVTGLPLQQAFPGLNFVLGSLANPRLVLDALSDVTNVQVVSSPSLVVLENQAAKLKVGAEVPVLTQQATSTDVSNPQIVNSVQFRDTGVILQVIPRVSSSGLVTMVVEQEISSVAASSEPGTLTPTINQRRINSTIAVYSGQTVLLGGLISEEDSREKERVPIVKEVPILGELVGKTDNARSRTELIVFIRPEVIRDGHDASLAAQELANRLRLVEPPGRQNHWRPAYKSGSRKDQ